MKKMSAKKQRILFTVIIVAIVIFDQLVKYYAQSVLRHMPGGEAEFIPGFMGLHYVQNTGMAFSLLSDATWLLAVLSAIMSIVVIYAVFRYVNVKSWLFKLAMCFIAGGAVGNLIDRLFRGYVVDMLKFQFVDFAIFNVADSFVSVGAVMLAIFVIWMWDKQKKDNKHVPEDNNN